MLAIFIGGLIGFQFGRFPGLLIGALLGFVASRALRAKLRQGVSRIQTQFLESTFAVMGAVCKADGVVTQDEIAVVEKLFERLRLSPDQKETSKAAFSRGKEPDFDLESELGLVLRVTRGQKNLLQMFLQAQVSAVAADGEVHPAEHKMLLRIARGLNLPEAQIDQLEAMLRGAQSGGTSKATTGQQLDDAYQVLGVSSSASDAEVKKAYRKLMSQNHPDKLAGRGLPESMREMAEEKTRKISHAYDVIKNSRETA